MSSDGCDMVMVQIPDGAEPGDSLDFERNGQTFSIEIPPASEPGQILQIRLASENEVPTKNENVTSLEMVTGSKISIVQSNNQTKMSNRCISDGTYKMLWPASRFIIDFINTHDFCREMQISKVQSVVELGSGHGMLGMAFVDVVSKFSSSDEPVRLVLTDVEDALPQLEANIRLNREIFGKTVDVVALPLRWHSQPIPRTNGNIDFILGSDLLYNCTNIPNLVATIRRLLTPKTKILFSVRWRKPIKEKMFFVLLDDIIEWKLIRGSCPLPYTSYGSSIESDTWFTQSTISVNGEACSLSLIDESRYSQMTAKQFEQFEELQTQIYLGVSRSIDHSNSCQAHDAAAFLETQINTDNPKKRKKFER